MRIQHNIAAMNAHRQLGGNNNQVSKNLEKLSSGFKINRAADDAAGLAISEKMRSQIRGLETASKNASDGISLIQTAEGALTEVHSMLNRMVELATTAANGTYADDDREKLQEEVNSLRGEIDRISKGTNFNGIKLLDGSLGKDVSVKAEGIADNAAQTLNTLGSTLTDITDGVKQTQVDAVGAKQDFYIGGFTSTNAAGVSTVVINYNDDAGAAKTVTLSMAAITTGGDTSITTAGILAGIKAATNAGATTNTGVTSKGTPATVTTTDSATDTAADGNFNGLFDVSLGADNRLVIKAKTGTQTISTGVTKDIASNKVDITSVAYTLTTTDKTAAESQLYNDLDGTAGATAPAGVALGSAAGAKTAGAILIPGRYTEASAKFSTGSIVHNAAIKINDITYFIKEAGKELNSDTQKLVAKEGANGRTVDIAAGGTGGDIKLAQAITKDAITNGFNATVNGGSIQIEETADRGKSILNNPNQSATKINNIIKNYETIDVSASGDTRITIADRSAIKNGTKLNIAGKSFEMVTNMKYATDGMNAVLIAEDDTDAAIATKLKDAINTLRNTDAAFKTATGALDATATGASVNINNTNSTLGSEVNNSGLVLQVGESDEAFQKVAVAVKDMSAKGLGIDTINVGIQDLAGQAIDSINSAIRSVSTQRSNMGALQNRLEHTINNLGVTTENLNAAESRIRDVDMAKEMMDFTKNNILTQAAQAMLAQANQLPQGVLQLLR